MRTDAHAARVLLEGKRAFGVGYCKGDVAHEILAGREVILAAGPIVSPKLLELSGIGNSEVLGAPGIETLHHLPVVATKA